MRYRLFQPMANVVSVSSMWNIQLPTAFPEVEKTRWSELSTGDDAWSLGHLHHNRRQAGLVRRCMRLLSSW
jgi:hypothetical protein